MIEFGLASNPSVRWLISAEKAVYDAVIDFYMGNTDLDYVEVAGPPTDEDLKAYRKHGDREAVPLPVVRLQLRPAKNSLTGEPGVEVLCTEDDLAEIERWRRLAVLAAFKAKGRPQ